MAALLANVNMFALLFWSHPSLKEVPLLGHNWRIGFFEEVGASVGSGALAGQAPILAKIECTFAQQLRWPGTIEVGVRVARIGTKSFVVSHAVAQAGRDGLVAHGDAVIVWFDYDAQTTVPVPDVLRAALERWG
jgi:acyl-CoA thioester hydrolase